MDDTFVTLVSTHEVISQLKIVAPLNILFVLIKLVGMPLGTDTKFAPPEKEIAVMVDPGIHVVVGLAVYTSVKYALPDVSKSVPIPVI
jgi:hypothetical protein